MGNNARMHAPAPLSHQVRMDDLMGINALMHCSREVLLHTVRYCAGRDTTTTVLTT